MSEPRSPFDPARGSDEMDALDVLDELRLIHAAERAPEAFKQRVIRAACARTLNLEGLEPHAMLDAGARVGGRWRESLRRCAAHLARLDVRVAHLGLALATLAVVAASRELWREPDVAVVPLAEPSVDSRHEPGASRFEAPRSESARSESARAAVPWSNEASCPQAIYPSQPAFDPASTDAEVRRAGVSVHTFLQETRSCGPVTRRYLEYAPRDHGAALSHAPIVLVLHGGLERAEDVRRLQTRERFEALARRDGFITVYANAVPSSDSDPDVPNAGRWQLSGELERQVDDVGYLEQIVRDMQRRGVVAGNNRVFLVGHGEGGSMALRAAAQRPDLYSGVAAVLPHAATAAPKLEPDSLLSRVLFVSIGDEMRAAVHDWALALGVTHKSIEQARAVAFADRVSEGHDYAGRDATALRSRSSRVSRVDIQAGGARNSEIRALFVSANAARLMPMPAPDHAELTATAGFRNQDIDSVDEAWSFLRGALGR